MNELDQCMARELGRYWRALIEEHYLIPEAKPSEGTQELSPTAKLALWGAAVRLLEENRSFVDKACVGAREEAETDPGRSHAA